MATTGMLWALAHSDGVLQYVKDTGMSMHELDPYQTTYDLEAAVEAVTSSSPGGKKASYLPDRPSDWAAGLARVMMEAHMRHLPQSASFREDMAEVYDRLAWSIFGNGAYASKIYDVVYSMIKDEFPGRLMDDIVKYSSLAVLDKYNWDTVPTGKYGAAGGLVFDALSGKFGWDPAAVDSTDWDQLPSAAKKVFSHTKTLYEKELRTLSNAADDAARAAQVNVINSKIKVTTAPPPVVAVAQPALPGRPLKAATVAGAPTTAAQAPSFLHFDRTDYTFSWVPVNDPYTFNTVPISVKNALNANSLADLETLARKDLADMNTISHQILQSAAGTPPAAAGSPPLQTAAGGSSPFGAPLKRAVAGGTVPAASTTPQTAPIMSQLRHVAASATPPAAAVAATQPALFSGALKRATAGGAQPTAIQAPSFLRFDKSNYTFSWDVVEDQSLFSTVPNAVKKAVGAYSVSDLMAKATADINAMNTESAKVLASAAGAGTPAVAPQPAAIAGAPTFGGLRKRVTAAGPTTAATVATANYLTFDTANNQFRWGSTVDPDLYQNVPQSVKKAIGIKDVQELYAKVDPANPQNDIDALNLTTAAIANFLTYDAKTNRFSWGTAEDPDVYDNVPRAVKRLIGVNSPQELYAKVNPTNPQIGVKSLNAMTSIVPALATGAGGATANEGYIRYDAPSSELVWDPTHIDDLMNYYDNLPDPIAKIKRLIFMPPGYVQLVSSFRAMLPDKLRDVMDKMNEKLRAYYSATQGAPPSADPNATENSPLYAKVIDMVTKVASAVFGLTDVKVDIPAAVRASQPQIFADAGGFAAWLKKVLMEVGMPSGRAVMSTVYSDMLDWTKYDAEVPNAPAVQAIVAGDANSLDADAVAGAVLTALCAPELLQSAREASGVASQWSARPADVQKGFDTLKQWFPHCEILGKDWYKPVAGAVVRRAKILRSPDNAPATAPSPLWDATEFTSDTPKGSVAWSAFAFTTHLLGLPDSYDKGIKLMATAYMNQEGQTVASYIEHENAILTQYDVDAILSLDNAAVAKLVNMCLAELINNQPIRYINDKAAYVDIIRKMVDRPIIRCMMQAFALWIARYMLWKQGIADRAQLEALDTLSITNACLYSTSADYETRYSNDDLKEPPDSSELIWKMIKCITYRVHGTISKSYLVKESVNEPLTFWKGSTDRFTANWLGTIIKFVQGRVDTVCVASAGPQMTGGALGAQGRGAHKAGFRIMETSCQMARDMVAQESSPADTRIMDWYMWIYNLWAVVPRSEDAFAALLLRAIKDKNYFLATGADLQRAKEIRASIANDDAAYNALPIIPYAPLPLTPEQVVEAEILAPFGLELDASNAYGLGVGAQDHNLSLVKLTKFVGCDVLTCVLQDIKNAYHVRKEAIELAGEKTPELWDVRPFDKVVDQIAALHKAVSPEVAAMATDQEKTEAARKFCDEVLAQFARFENVTEANAPRLLEDYYLANIDEAKADLGLEVDLQLTPQNKSIVRKQISNAVADITSTSPDVMLDKFYSAIVDVIFDPTEDPTKLDEQTKKVLGVKLRSVDATVAMMKNIKIINTATAATTVNLAVTPRLRSSAAATKAVISRAADELEKIVHDFVPPQYLDDMRVTYRQLQQYASSTDAEVNTAISAETVKKISDLLDDQSFWILLSTAEDPWHVFAMQAVKRVYDLYMANGYASNVMNELRTAAYVKPIYGAGSSKGKGMARGQAAIVQKYVKVEAADMAATQTILNDFVALVMAEITAQALVGWYHRYDHHNTETMVYVAKIIWGKFYPALKAHADGGAALPAMSKYEQSYIEPGFYAAAYKYARDTLNLLDSDRDSVMWCVFFNDFRRIENSAVSPFTAKRGKNEARCSLGMLQSERYEINAMMTRVRIKLADARKASLYHTAMSAYAVDPAVIASRTSALRLKYIKSAKADLSNIPSDAVLVVRAVEDLTQEAAGKMGRIVVGRAEAQIKGRDLLLTEVLDSEEGSPKRAAPAGRGDKRDAADPPSKTRISEEFQKTQLEARTKTDLTEFTKEYDEGSAKKQDWLTAKKAVYTGLGFADPIAQKKAEDDFWEFRRTFLADKLADYAVTTLTPEFIDQEADTRYQIALEEYAKKTTKASKKDADEMMLSVNAAAVALGLDGYVKIQGETVNSSYLVYVKRMVKKRLESIKDTLAADVSAANADSAVKRALGSADVAAATAADKGTLGALFADSAFTHNLSQI